MTVEIRGLSKRFGASAALSEVDLVVRGGEVHALLGHNGAGKSTLISCLGGRMTPTSGSIVLDGVAHSALTPREAIRAGVAVIYQTLSVVDSLTVADNVFLGAERTRRGAVDRRAQERATQTLLHRLGADFRAGDTVGALTSGQRQLVEIAKALNRSARLIVFDEPTAALSARESDRLAEVVRELRGMGVAILYVTHLLQEVMKLADAVTVLRDGRVVWEAPRVDTLTKEDLVRAIRDADAPVRTPTAQDTALRGLPILELDGHGSTGRAPANLTVHAGEIVALFGSIGSGRSEFLETLSGARPASGSMRVCGRNVRFRHPRAAIRGGVVRVPHDRLRAGLFLSLSAQDNALFLQQPELARSGVRSPARERAAYAHIVSAFAVRPADGALPIRSLSGGNQQKLLIARFVSGARPARVLIVEEPTQGVDVAAREEIYAALRARARENGMAVLVSTNTAEEVKALADRCLVFAGGAIRHDLATTGVSEDELTSLLHDSEPMGATR